MYLRLEQLQQIIDHRASSIAGSSHDYSAFQGRLRYQRIVDVTPPPPHCDLLIDVNDLSSIIRSRYIREMGDAVTITSGRFEFRNFGFFGPCALPADLEEGLFLVGEQFLFSMEYTRWYLDACRHNGSYRDFAWSPDGQHTSLTLSDEQFHEFNDPCLILANPGQSIYGHWILDMAPRLLLIKKGGFGLGIAVVLNHAPNWAPIFFKAFDFTPASVTSFAPGLTRVRSALMPSATKAGHRLATPLMPDAWRQLKRFFEEENRQSREHDALPRPAKIFVSRRLWHDDRRVIQNISDVEKAAAARGYTIIHPEKYSVAQQAAMFSRARAIIGEDGSGLHNVIFAEPGCVLGVIGVPERTNLWHLGICELLGHRSAYIQACFDANGQRMVRAVDASDLLSAIDAHTTL